MNLIAITAVMALGLLATIVASVVSVSDLIYRQYNDHITIMRLEEAAAAIQANSVVLNGIRYLPAADNTGTYATIPAWVMPNARTVTGIPFHYCPFATRDVNGIVPGNVTVTTNKYPPSGTAYTASSIDTMNIPYTRNRDYVFARMRQAFTGAGASLSPTDVLAVIIAPSGKNTSISTSCPGALDAAGNLTASGNYVRVVSDNQPLQQQAAAQNQTAVFYVGASATGDGSGIDPNNRITLDAVFSQLHGLKPWRAQLYLAAGAYTWNNPSNIHAGSSYPKGNFRQIEYRLEGAGGGSTTITINGDLDLPVNWQLKNLALNFSGSYRLKAPPMTTLIADGITITGGLQLKGGEMWVLNNNIFNDNIYLTDGGRMTINGTVTSTVGTANPTGSTGIQIRGGGQVNMLNGSTWNVYNTDTSLPSTYYKGPIWLRVGGRLTVQGALNIFPNSDTGGSGNLYAGIVSDIGSTLVVTGSVITYTSSSSVSIGTGAKSFTTQMGLPLNTSSYLLISQSSNPARYMYGKVTAYNSSTGALTVNVTDYGGAGTSSSWNIGGAVLNIENPQTHAVFLNGSMHVNNGLLLTPSWSQTANAYVYLINGGELTLHNGAAIGSSSDTTQRLAFGVIDLSGNSVYGGDTSQDSSNAVYIYVQSNSVNSNSRCWDGDTTIKSPNTVYPHLFYDSAAGTNGNNSAPLDSSNLQYLRLINITSWNCVRG